MAAFDAGRAADPRTANAAAEAPAVRATVPEVEHRISGLLGPAGYSRYRDHQSKFSRWLTACQLDEALRGSPTPLTLPQATRLVALLRQSTPGDRAAGGGLNIEGGSGLFPDPFPNRPFASVREAAGSFLFPPQLAALHRVEQQQEIGWDEEPRVPPRISGAPGAKGTGRGQVYEPGSLDHDPAVLNSPSPEYPLNLHDQGITGQALIDFLVQPDGTVSDARALSADRPEFEVNALAAVRQWTFAPGRIAGLAVTTHMQVPIVFQLDPPTSLAALNFNLGKPTYVTDMRTGARSVQLHFVPKGTADSQIKAARVILTRAEDDTGASLRQDGTPAFSQPTVGRMAGDEAETTSRQPILLTLSGLAPGAKTIKSVDAVLEAFLPGFDPGATQTFDDLAAKFGSPLRASVLTKAGVTLVIYDQATGERMSAANAPGGPQDFDTGPYFGGKNKAAFLVAAGVPRSVAEKLAAAPPPDPAHLGPEQNRMKAGDIAVGLRDPGQRVIAVEFQARDGSPLPYNHNGHYHSGGQAGQRFDVYNLGATIPPDARMVCWSLTDASVVKVPLKLADLRLP